MIESLSNIIHVMLNKFRLKMHNIGDRLYCFKLSPKLSTLGAHIVGKFDILRGRYSILMIQTMHDKQVTRCL